MEYICIDLKCYYASYECVERKLDPFRTALVVADPSRGKGAICLAVSPRMKELGVKNRCRLFDIPKNINYIIAKPRMQKYIEMSACIYNIYLKYVSKEDIHVYSIDEVFIDVTCYLKYYKKSPIEIGEMIVKDIYKNTGITATYGCGNNMFLAKIAMDIIAKKTKGNCAYLTTEEFKEKLWDYKPLSKFWQIGKGIEKRLNKMGLYTLKDVANCPEDKLYKEFGVNAYFLINHANGLDPTTIKEIKEYMPKQKSVSNGQVLERDYDYEECKLIIKEMVDTLVLEIVQMNLVTNVVSLTVGYSNELELPFVGGSKKLSVVTASYKIILDEILKIYEEKINKQYPIRRVNISFGNLQDESKEYYDLFTDLNSIEKEKKLQDAVIDIKGKFGKSSILKGMSLEEHAMQKKRNKLIGGHNGE